MIKAYFYLASFLYPLICLSEITMTTPLYLYKILSVENWEASQASLTVKLTPEDEPFIHFATETQVERIAKKYWADVPDFYVLTIDPAKLTGRVVLEANPGGSTLYYHLYEGSIPLRAVLEARKVSSSDPFPQLSLPLVQIGHPVLREAARPLARAEVLSPEIQALILKMQVKLRDAPGVGLAANQVGLPIQLLVIEDRKEYHSCLTVEQLEKRERVEVPFHTIINPQLTLEAGEKVAFYEGCLSIPELRGLVPRARKVHVEGLNEKGEPVSIDASGWYARILQHEVDHLQGRLFLDKVITASLTNNQHHKTYWSY